jgi:cytochrome c oxidase assembly factor CtaG/cytochrome c2
MWLLRLQLWIDTVLSYCASSHARVPPDRWFQWQFEPIVATSLAVVAALYVLGLYRLSNQIEVRIRPDKPHIGAFFSGILLVFVALCSPIETLADSLFSMHMGQHILLTMMAPPLLVWSHPRPVFAAAFSDSWRERAANAWSAFGLDHLTSFVMHPINVFLLFCGAFVFWHLPIPYLWGLRYETAHVLEHASFLFVALVFWTLIIEPSGKRRLGYGAALLFLTVTVLVSDLPGALMVLSPRSLYPIHADGAAAWGLSVMQDQELAGLIMWIPAGAIYLAAAIWLFVRLLEETEPNELSVKRSALLILPVVLLPLLVGFGGRAHAAETSFGGDPGRGAALIGRFGCGACHTIPGIDDADGLVGPPLNHMAKRVYVAGVLRNTPDNMITWLRDPQSVVPNNAMPNVGLDEQQARDVAAYLSTLQ